MDKLTRQSRKRSDEVLVEHAAAHGEFGVRELTWELSAAEYEALLERFEDEAAGGAGVWVTRGDAVLLVRHASETAWSDPGGKREPGESFREAACREVREESGVDIEVEGVLETHVVTHVTAGRPPLVSPIVVFEGTYVGGDPTPREDDRVAEVRWFAERPESLLYDALASFPMPEGDG
ncbi:ADP-ribose pyrophosphatase [Halobacteriales archaeon QS_9_68_42]|nr:MAG: ADP-ribose pyrophosphatase [Halobacteriales archaeon QS_9_68_42]